MAAFNYDDYGDSGSGGSLVAALNWAGAFLSVVLIAGLATWGWKLWVRDVSGVPVVRALEGPMRVAPEDPGGLASEYQGLSVNRIAEERVEESAAERVVLAPQPEVLVEDEDLTMAELQPMIEPEPLVSAETVAPDSVPEVADARATPEFPVEGTDGAAAILESTEEEPKGTDMAVMMALGLAEEGEVEADPVQVVEAAPGVPVVTPRPLLRPENLQAVSFRPSADGGHGEIDPASIPAGTRLVQLGAFGSEEIARAEWDAANTRFGSYMLGKERVIQEAETGGRTFWRLRAMGFEDLSDARRFCSVLVADGANCIPVVQE